MTQMYSLQTLRSMWLKPHVLLLFGQHRDNQIFVKYGFTLGSTLVCQHRLDLNCLLKCDFVCFATYLNLIQISWIGEKSSSDLSRQFTSSPCWLTHQSAESRVWICICSGRGEGGCLSLLSQTVAYVSNLMIMLLCGKFIFFFSFVYVCVLLFLTV